MLHVHLLNVLDSSDPMDLDALRDRLEPGTEITAGPELPQPATFDILVAGHPSREHLAASPSLRALIVPFAGPPESTRRLLAEFPQVSLHNLHHNTAPTAEMALALLLAAARFIVPADRRLRQGDWSQRHQPPPVTILHGQTALILGYGAIGQHVARVCQALGMQIVAVRRRPEAGDPAGLAADIRGLNDLPDLLPRASALIITLPLTEATRGLIGAREIALLPDRALLVNVGRGPVVDERALYEALRDGKLAAAGLDVWYQYPDPADLEAQMHTLPAHYPFHEMENVVMSPHCGGAYGTAYTERERMVHLARLLNAAARGEPMPNRVDLAEGY